VVDGSLEVDGLDAVLRLDSV